MLQHVRRHLPEYPRCRTQVIRAAQGRLGDTADDGKARHQPRRWTTALALLGSLVAVALIWRFDERHGLQFSELSVAETSPPGEVSIGVPLPTPEAQPPAAGADTRDPCQDTLPVRQDSPRARRRLGTGTAKGQDPTPRVEAAAVDATVVAEADVKAGVLADGRHVRLTLD
jgi:hypothetical protein